MATKGKVLSIEEKVKVIKETINGRNEASLTLKDTLPLNHDYLNLLRSENKQLQKC